MINTITTATTRMPSEEPGMETGVGVGTITSVAGMGVRVMPGNAEAGTLKAALIIASAIPRLSSRIKRKAFGGIFMGVSDFLNAPEYITQSWLVMEAKEQTSCKMREVDSLAERAGFEPANPYGLHALQACALGQTTRPLPAAFLGQRELYQKRTMNPAEQRTYQDINCQNMEY